MPRFYRFILRTGAPRGYHTIGLTYPNDQTIGDLCANSTVTDCTGLARNEVVTGTDSSPLVNVNQGNSITGRLSALISYLAATYPNKGWGQNLDHSVMFSGPSDSCIALRSPAPRFSMANVTPVSRQCGFTSLFRESSKPADF